MRLYFAGYEVPSHRNILAEIGAQDVALSYMGLRRKIQFARPWIISEKVERANLKANRAENEVNIFLDSGAYTVNKNPLDYTVGDLKDISAHYQEFVTQNVDTVEMVSEFDSMALGREWIEDQRDSFYNHLPEDKFLPLWHPEWGLDYLTEMSSEYRRIGIISTVIGGRDLTPFLNSIVQEKGTRLHGVAMTQVDEMSNIKWDSVSSTSWISPQQFGDTIVWTGRELKRYPKKYKEQARRRFRTLFEREGFDAEKIANDDSSEVLRLSVWSWQQLVNDIEKKQNRPLAAVPTQQGSNYMDDSDDSPFVEIEGDLVDTSTGEMRKSVSTPALLKQRVPTPLPVLGVTTTEETVTDPESGEETTVTSTEVTIRSESQRKCDTCFLSSKCPAFEPQSTCAYNIPVEVKTKDQFVGVQNSLIEMQVQRVMFMKFAEDQEGGYADPNLSSEMDRLQKMLKTKNDMDQEGFSFKIEGKSVGGQQGQTGMLARLFGESAQQKANQLPAPVQVEQVVDIIDADFTEGPA